MTVQVTDRLSQLYVGNGVNTRFDFTFRIFDQEDETGVAVRIKVGNEFEFLDETKYTVTINPDNLGGYVNFLDEPDAQTYFYIAGKTPVDQLLDITNYDNFYPDAIERALDKLTAILQEWKHLVDFETQARILADLNYDELAQQRESELKAYIDGIASAITGQPVLGLPAKFVVDDSGKTQQQINDALTQGYAFVEFFGDTTNDATAAINACLLYCKANNKTAKSLPNKIYPVSGTITVATSCNFAGSTFIWPNSFNSVGIDIKKDNGTTIELLRDLNIKLPKVLSGKAIGVAPKAGSIGVKITALRDSTVLFDSVQGFEENLQIFSNNSELYTAYNDYRFTGLFVGSKINIHMLCESSGWINECSWHGGHFAEYSQDHAAYNAINLKISKPDTGGNNAPNGHTFVRCSMEGNFSQTIDYDFNPLIATSYYSCNTFVNCRFEAAVSMRFSPYALYDLFINCLGLGGVSFVNDVRPNASGSPRYSNMSMDIAATPGATGFRNSKATHLFQTGNSSGAIALSTGFQNRINGGLLAAGSYALFNSSDATKLEPIVKIALDAGSPALLMGNGVGSPTEKLYRNANNDWRMTFNLFPAVDGGSNLGSSGLRYGTIYSQSLNLSSGLGLFGSASVATKPTVSGSRGGNAALTSLLTALASYGLIMDNTTT